MLVPHAINRHVLMSTESCINKPFYALLMTLFAPLHMQDSGQYSINTEARGSLQLYVFMKDLWHELYRFGYCKNGREDDIERKNY